MYDYNFFNPVQNNMPGALTPEDEKKRAQDELDNFVSQASSLEEIKQMTGDDDKKAIDRAARVGGYALGPEGRHILGALKPKEAVKMYEKRENDRNQPPSVTPTTPHSQENIEFLRELQDSSPQTLATYQNMQNALASTLYEPEIPQELPRPDQSTALGLGLMDSVRKHFRDEESNDALQYMDGLKAEQLAQLAQAQEGPNVHGILGAMKTLQDMRSSEFDSIKDLETAIWNRQKHGLDYEQKDRIEDAKNRQKWGKELLNLGFKKQQQEDLQDYRSDTLDLNKKKQEDLQDYRSDDLEIKQQNLELKKQKEIGKAEKGVDRKLKLKPQVLSDGKVGPSETVEQYNERTGTKPLIDQLDNNDKARKLYTDGVKTLDSVSLTKSAIVQNKKVIGNLQSIDDLLVEGIKEGNFDKIESNLIKIARSVALERGNIARTEATQQIVETLGYKIAKVKNFIFGQGKASPDAMLTVLDNLAHAYKAVAMTMDRFKNQDKKLLAERFSDFSPESWDQTLAARYDTAGIVMNLPDLRDLPKTTIKSAKQQKRYYKIKKRVDEINKQFNLQNKNIEEEDWFDKFLEAQEE